MGMFDSIEFREGNTKYPPKMTPNLQKEDWQTKELYDCMHRLVFQNDQMYYLDHAGNLDPLPMTGSFEIHTYLRDSDEWFQFQVTVNEGKLVSIGELTDARYRGLPHVPGMERDAEKSAEGWENTIAWFQKLEDERTWLQKLDLRYRSARYEWRQAWEHLVRGFKKFFGMSVL